MVHTVIVFVKQWDLHTQWLPKQYRQLSKGYIQVIPSWLLISAKSSHFLSLLSVQRTPSVSSIHSNILQNSDKIFLVGGTLILYS